MAHIDTIKRTKILATIGPATDSPEILEQIIRSGVNACRMNFSHGSEQERIQEITSIRAIEQKLNRHIAIVQDLQGPKIRLGQLKDDMRYNIEANDELGLTYGIEHDGGNNLPSQYDLTDKCKPGDAIYLFDGKIKTIVQRIENNTVWVKALNRGFVLSRKAINLPDMAGAAADSLTAKDLADLEWSLDKDIDFTAISFVHTAEDVIKLRRLLESKGSDRMIITKLETKTAADPKNLEDIVIASDGVMVARGDLAVEAGAEIVPILERRIIELCQKHCKFCIVATQMLASMVDSPEPTRAEVSDIATAAIEGADAVMLSDETAMGKYPVEAVTIMNKTLMYTQKDRPVYSLYVRNGSDPQRDAIAKTAIDLAKKIDADAIMVESASGWMARNVAVNRPDIPMLAVVPTSKLANRLSLLFSGRTFIGQAGECESIARKLVSENFFGKPDPKIILIQCVYSNMANKGIANTIRLMDFSNQVES